MLLGVILGILGVLYNKLLDKMQDFFDRFDSKFISIGIMLMISFLMMFIYPTVLGSGNDLVKVISDGKFTMIALAILLVAKLFFSTSSFGTGTPGGIFLPLLVIGAITGGLYSTFLSTAFGVEEYYIKGFVIIAMAGFFSAIVRAPNHRGYPHHRDDWKLHDTVITRGSIARRICSRRSTWRRTSIRSAYAQEAAKEGGERIRHTRP